MGVEEAKADSALIYIEALDKKLDAVLENIAGERAESGRRFEVHSQAIINSIPPAVAKATERVEKTMGGMLEAYLERMHSCTDSQDRAIDNMMSVIETFRVSVESHGAAIREIKKEQDELKELMNDPETGAISRIGKLESKPGQVAIKAWQWMAAGGVSAAGIAFGIISWIIAH